MAAIQYHFYLNDDKISDNFIIEKLNQERNVSGLIKGLLFSFYKDNEPYAREKENAMNTKER
jgi:hypothetical protein